MKTPLMFFETWAIRITGVIILSLLALVVAEGPDITGVWRDEGGASQLEIRADGTCQLDLKLGQSGTIRGVGSWKRLRTALNGHSYYELRLGSATHCRVEFDPRVRVLSVQPPGYVVAFVLTRDE